MLTLFAVPKPFRGHLAVIQRNAIGSWVRLHPPCEILLFGNEQGTAEVVKEFGLVHVPDVARNEYGTPLVNDLFEKAQRLATHDLLCYVNSDIILMGDFMRAVERVSRLKKHFLMVGECWNLDLAERLVFDQPEWEEQLRGLARQRGTPRGPYGIDYFAFPRGFYERLPPLTVGRWYIDNWLLWKARAIKAALVDATHIVTSIHQNHDYSHIDGGVGWIAGGEEARRNLELLGGRMHRHLISDATHTLEQDGLKRNLAGYFRLKSLWENAKIEATLWGFRFVDWTRPIRHPLGLRMATLKRLKAYLFR